MLDAAKGEFITFYADLYEYHSSSLPSWSHLLALVVFGPLELLNKSLQSASASVGQMLEAVKTVKQEILSSRTEESFHSLFAATVESAAELDLEPIVLPRQRKPPKRFTGPAASATHHHIYISGRVLQ